MPNPAQTPASRRFLPPSSSSHMRTSSSATNTSNPLKSSQAYSSSPFARTPFRHPSARGDEIETTLDDEFSPLTQSKLPLVASKQKQDVSFDGIEDVEDHTIASEILPPHHVDSDHLENVGYAIPSSTPSRPSTVTEHFSSPLPKRQKRVHVFTSDQNTDLAPSSPPTTGVEDPIANDTDTYLPPNQARDQETLSEIDEERDTKPRFRNPPPAYSAPAEKAGKPGFRAHFRDVGAGESSRFDAPLPEAFSPSRRKGKKGYKQGGAADTVRRWVLDIANEQSHGADKQENVVHVLQVQSDCSDRFDINEDEEGTQWMMIRQQGMPKIPPRSKATIRVKGAGTQWKLSLGDQSALNVAVLWEIAK